MVRAGLVRQLGAGLWTFLPAGWRAHENAAQIVREEMDAIGCQEMLMPVINPADLWQRSGRYSIDEVFKLQDRRGAEMVLALTARGGHHLPRLRDRALLPPAAVLGLPLPDQGPRRGAAAGGDPADARVHHEGRLHLRPRPRGPRRALRALPRRLRPHLRPRGARVVPGRVGRRCHGRHRRPRVHGAVRGRRERRRAGARLRRQRRDRERRARAGRAAGPAQRPRGGPDPGPDHDRRGRELAAPAGGRAAQELPGDGRGPRARARRPARRPPGQRDQAPQHARRAVPRRP